MQPEPQNPRQTQLQKPELYQLSLGDISLQVSNVGASILNLEVPGRQGRSNVVLRYSSLNEYLDNPSCLGAVAGRVANRIDQGRFLIDGQHFQVTVNEADRSNCLHGGAKGFHKAIWKKELQSATQICFSLDSPDGDQGFPGNLHAEVTYKLDKDGKLEVSYYAITDKATVVNLTNHSYFNLEGVGSGFNVRDQKLWVRAARYLPVNARMIPTGDISEVSGPFDLRGRKTIQQIIAENNGEGLDNYFLLNTAGSSGELHLAASLRCEKTGRVMEVFTDQAGVQIYMANHMNGSERGPGGLYERHAGICFETQSPPDAMNHPHFRSIVLRPGQEYRAKTIFQFHTF